MATAKLSSGQKSVSLQTQRDGRAFAVEVLKRLGNADVDKCTAYPYAIEYEHGERIIPYRRGPQWDRFYRDLSHLIRDGNIDAIKGFASIFTDALAGNINQTFKHYQEMEDAGLFQGFGSPLSAYPKPRRLSLEETTKRNADVQREATRVFSDESKGSTSDPVKRADEMFARLKARRPENRPEPAFNSEAQRRAHEVVAANLRVIAEQVEGCKSLLENAESELRKKLEQIATAHKNCSDEEDLEDQIDLADSSKIARALEDFDAVRASAAAIVRKLKTIAQDAA